MARIEWVKQRLENWALWKERDDTGGLGFPSSSSFTREAVDNGTREAVIPVDSIEAEVTDQAVKSLQLVRSHLHATICAIYLEGIGIEGAGRKLFKASSTIKAHLEQGDQALAEWFSARAERQKRQREEAELLKQRGFTT